MIVTAIVAVVWLSAAQVQTQPGVQVVPPQTTPPRDPKAPDTKGTGVIRGRITNAEGRPLRRVQVRLNGESVPDGRTASTNGLGQYELRNLPAGRYSLNASRAGYLSMSYGQTRPGESGRPLELADAQTLEKVDLVLTHTAIISGHVLDEVGEPLAGANVMAMQMRFFNGSRRLLPVRGNFISDDTGQYRISGLDPGEYYVQASSRETWETDPPDRQMLGFLPTFYPSSPNTQEAQRIRVKAGQEATGMDVGLVAGKVTKISGTATNAQGQPLVGETLSLGFEIHGENFASFFGGQGTKVNPDGTFLFRNVAPGEYHINVRTPATADRPVEATNVTVSTLGGDVEGLAIVTSSAGSVRGAVSVDADTPLPVALTRLVVRPLPADRDAAVNTFNLLSPGNDNGRVHDDGRFELAGIVGSNRLSIAPLPDGWALRRIEFNGRDYTSLPLDAQGQAMDGVLVTITNKFPTLSGTLQDDKGNPATTGTVILFPQDSALWQEDLRTVRTARPDQSGLFSVKAARPGEYLAIALDGVVNNVWNDPDFLNSVRDQATPLSLREGDRPQIQLTLKTLPPQ